MTNINHLLRKLRDAGDRASYKPHLYHEAANVIEQLQKAMVVQGNAVKVLHQAETSELNHLRKTAQEAYAAKMTLDSEREANKILTDEIERLREAINKVIKKMEGKGMGDWPEARILAKALKEKS